MKKQIIIIILLLIGWMSGSGQKYENLGNFSGYPVESSDVGGIELLANGIDSIFPQQFRGKFKVYDFSYYLYNEHMIGTNNVDAIWSKVISMVDEKREYPYYVIFGTEINSLGERKLRVKFALPKEGEFSCMLPVKLQIISGKLEKILNESDDIYQNKISALKYFKEQVSEIIDCCVGNRSECSQCLSIQELDDALTGYNKVNISISNQTLTNATFSFGSKIIDYGLALQNFKLQSSACNSFSISDEFLKICDISNISSISNSNSDCNFIFVDGDVGSDFLYYKSTDENDYFVNEFYNFMLYDIKSNKNQMSDDYFDINGKYLGGSDNGTGKMMIVENIPADLKTKSYSERIEYYKNHCKDFQSGTIGSQGIIMKNIATYYYKNYINCNASIKLTSIPNVAESGCAVTYLPTSISENNDYYISPCPNGAMAIDVGAVWGRGNVFDPSTVANKYDLITVFYHEQYHLDFDHVALPDGKYKIFITAKMIDLGSITIQCGDNCVSRHLDGAYWAGCNSPFFPLTSEKFKVATSENLISLINDLQFEHSKKYFTNKFKNFIKK